MNARPDLLNLPGLRVLTVHETESQYTVEVAVAHPTQKPCCLFFPLGSRRFGAPEVRFRDLPTHGKFVELVLRRQKHQCLKCGSIVSDDVPDVDVSRRMTDRLKRWIGEQAATRTFADVARESGLSEGTVRNVFRDHVSMRLWQYQFETPRVIGVDEKHLNNAYRFIIGNVEKRTLLDILPGRELKDLSAYFEGRPDLNRIEVWCQDMFAPYKQLQRRHAPQAQLVVDKFHVLQLATLAVENIRRRVNKSLTTVDRRRLKRQRTLMFARHDRLSDRSRELMEEWFHMAPVLRDAYETKEGLFALYDCASKDDAERWFKAWGDQLDGPTKPDFEKIVATIRTWRDGVFGYFEHPYTNAYVEGVNRLIGGLHRNGRGYDFDTLRAKALLSHGIHKVVQPKFRRRAGPPDDSMAMVDLDRFFAPTPEPINYGVSIDDLQRLLSTGEW